MVNGTSLMVSVPPTIAGSPASLRCHSRALISAIGSVPVAALSSALKTRPAIGRTRSA